MPRAITEQDALRTLEAARGRLALVDAQHQREPTPSTEVRRAHAHAMVDQAETMLSLARRLEQPGDGQD